MASGRAPCTGCQQRDQELLLLRRRLAVLTEEHEALQRENHRLVRRLAKVERQNDQLHQRLDEVRREQHRQTHPFRRQKTKSGHARSPDAPRDTSRLSILCLLPSRSIASSTCPCTSAPPAT